MFQQDNIQKFINGRQGYEGYSCSNSSCITYHLPQAEELMKLNRQITELRNRFTFAFLFSAALMTGTFIVFSIVEKTLFILPIAGVVDVLLILISLIMKKVFSTPSAVAYGTVIGYTAMGNYCIDVKPDRVLVTNLARLRGDVILALDTEVAVMKYGSCYFVVPAE